MIHIIKGQTSGHIEGQPAGLVEWQFSDGPAGNRASSDDYLDLAKGLRAHWGHLFNIDEADFTEDEHQIFLENRL